MISRRTLIGGVALTPFATAVPWAGASRLALAQAMGGDNLHGITEYGAPPEYPPGFPHWAYVDPSAPKDGDLIVSAFGSFDSLNTFIVRGVPAAGIDIIYEALLTGNGDELLASYIDVAETMSVADDRSWAEFRIRPEARFHDGAPITAVDVVWTHEIFRDKGAPRFRIRFYDWMESIEAIDERTVRFTRKPEAERNLCLDLAGFPILPKHWWEGRNFDDPILDPPLGSGPYRVRSVDPGRSITYELVEDWWARDLPQNRGTNNFRTIRYEYYRDPSVEMEAFKAGQFDYNDISSSQEWTTGFTGLRAVEQGLLKLEQIPNNAPAGFNGFWFNLRRPMFQNVKVREALAWFYDFETAKRTIHFGLYDRVRSYFTNSDLASSGLPEGRELEILAAYRDRVDERIFTEPPYLPTTDGSGEIRNNLRQALRLFREAGWEVKGGALTETATGQRMDFEILYVSPNLEKVINALVENFRRGGITARPRLVDSAQYSNRIDAKDYDMIILGLRAFFPPGSPLRGLWKSAAADEFGNENFSGIKDEVLDELVELVIAAESYDELVARGRALDRYLLWQWVTIPTYWDNTLRFAYWDMFGRPATFPKYGSGFPTTWWFDGSRPGADRARRRG